MSRKIKFRAWHIEEKKYYSVLGIDFKSEEILIRKGGFFRSLSREEYEEDVIIPMGEVVLEQYTGLKDKNGKKIYEGDICKISYFGKWVNVAVERHTTDFIVVNRKGEDYVGRALGGYANVIEIIGNIHENGDLLK